MGYGILATVEKYDLSDLKRARRQGAPVSESELGLAPKVWAPGIGSRFGKPVSRERPLLEPAEVVASWSPLIMPGIDIADVDFRMPDSVAQLLEQSLTPIDYVEAAGNLVTTAGALKLWKLGVNQGAQQAYDATHTRIGVGNGSTAAAAGDTDFSGASKWWQIVDALGTPSTNALAFTATHPTGQSNFVWNEYGMDAGTSSGATVTAVLFNHAVVNLGTKTSAAAWAFTTTFTLS